ncbi:exosome complex component RRP45A-like [Impatiens glandulifera]|uniref:exosome complex component RRP45A-like n=1 Tax=Impatiens glandulifera TaxID=253017 RepID=UPI001FB147BB|nr:exosome complex component RRP45A-like [Impatiens glandulifera]XP_047316360.1 exosome complex component RRP45A-like [Impatiens glandulifera]
MEQRLGSTWELTVNEKTFIETALKSDLRTDGRRPFDYRRITIKFGREDGSSEVQLGQTHVMGFVSSQLVQPYRERPNEGTLSIFTEFSPMADPSFEAGRPGEYAVELGRIVDRGLRESRAVDTESLCVVAGKFVWSIRIDLHILDNGGNLVDAANIAALAALMTFRRPECSLEGEDGQEVVVHSPEVKEPLPLTIHHLPIAVSFAFVGNENTVIIDPSHSEEAVMGGSLTATINTNGDVCAIQKAGGVGVLQSVIMQCLRIASVKAADITNKIKTAVEAYNIERAQRKIKRHPTSVPMDLSEPVTKLEIEEKNCNESNNMECEFQPLEPNGTKKKDTRATSFIGGPSSWDPISKGVNMEELRASLASRAVTSSTTPKKEQHPEEAELKKTTDQTPPMAVEASVETSGQKTLLDAVKPKHKRKKKQSRNINSN